MKKFPKPYRKGYLDVGEGHNLYYEFVGNKKGIPIIFLHGGPGSGFSEKNKGFFDFKKQNVLFFDQRGAGRSKPFASIKANTTGKLVQDINKIMDFAGIKKAIVFGGSWGSTLALAYAIKFPERVLGMVLRGIYTGSREENEFYTENTKYIFPAEYARMISLVPEKERKNIIRHYHKKMISGSKKRRRKYAYEWALYEHSILQLVPEKNAEKSLKKYPFEALGVLETYYISNGCFMPDGYILKNAGRLRKIPISIIHGRYDMICPVYTAFWLHEALPKSKLHIMTSGHSASDPETKKKLIDELHRISGIIKKF